MSIVNLSGKTAPHALRANGDNRYHPPRLLNMPVPRAAIMRKLQEMQGHVVLIKGPHGSGKTTTLAMHQDDLAGRGARTGWLTLTGEDNQPEVLRSHIFRAFAPDCVVSEELPDVPDNFFGFIDGLDKLSNSEAHDLIVDFILRVPSSSVFHISTTRTNGALLHDGLLRGVVSVIGPEELRLNNEEASALMGQEWTMAEVMRLNWFVDGWAAGLRFLARAPDAARRILKSTDANSAVPAEMADYFDDVICGGMEPAILSALTGFSVIKRFPHQLVSDMPDSARNWPLLEEQIRLGAFVHYTDEARGWIAFHPAFGHHLRQRLLRHSPARYDDLRRFAATWFERNGFPAEAVRHAVTIVEKPVAARIIESAGAINVDLSDGPDVALGEIVPPEKAGELPLVFLGQIYHLVRHGRQNEARKFFDAACCATQDFTRLSVSSDPALIRGWANLMSVLFLAVDDLPISQAQIDMMETGIRLHLGTQPILAAGIASVLAFVYLDQSRYSESLKICNLGLRAQFAPNANKVTVFLLVHQASNAIARDTIEKAVTCIEDAQRLAAVECSDSSYEVLISQIMRAVLHYENNELESAQQLLAPALKSIGSINGWVRLYAEAYSTAAALAAILDGFDQMETVLHAGEAFAYERGLPRLSRLMAIIRLREYTRAGEWRDAMAMLEVAPLNTLLVDSGLSAADLSQQVPALLEVARLMLELGRSSEANAFLERIDRTVLETADNRLRLNFNIMSMRAAFGMRRYSSAVEHMQVAIGIARQSGLIRHALDERRYLIEVFDWSQRNGRLLPPSIAGYIEGMLRNAEGPCTWPVTEQQKPKWTVEQASQNFTLSPRESEIIALIAEGYINKEIATRLGISEGTVKTHRKKIHEKLGVTSRSQAIQRARELLIVT